MQIMSFRQLAFSTALALSLGALPGQAGANTVFTVQLGSFESEKEARTHWQKLEKRFPDLFEPLNYASAKVQLPPDDFVYFRTQAGPINSRSEADEICRRLVVNEFECYVAETAMFMADGDNTPDTGAEEVAAATPALPPAPKETPRAAEEAMVDMLEAQETDSPERIVPTAPVSAPAPLPTAAPVAAAPAAPVEVASSKTQARTAATPPQAAVAAPAPAPVAQPLPWANLSSGAPSASGRSGASPFQRGESAYATSNQPAAPAPAYTPRISGAYNVSVPAVPVGDSDGSGLKVAEAVPVPLGTVPPAPVISNYSTAQQQTLPSQHTSRPSLWAEISYFSSQETALNYWRTLRTRDQTVPQGLRLRIVKPLRQSQGKPERLSLRIGPFDNTNAIRRLCSYTAPERMRCQAMRDVGAPVSYAEQREQIRAQRRGAAISSSTAATAGASSIYWLQLGAYPSAEMAKSQWAMLKSAHPAALAKLNEQIFPPSYSSATRPMYRLRVGPFTSNLDASNTCMALQRGGASCLVVTGR